MTLEEKSKIIKEGKEKKYLYISPRTIQGGATLIRSYETLELYENMDSNTLKFAEKEIVNLVSTAEYNNQEARKYLNFNLVFCGGFDDLPDDLGSPIDFIMNHKDKIVAVYKYLDGTEHREYFIGFAQTEVINTYGYLYLNLENMLRIFEENNVKYEIDMVVDRFTPAIYRDDISTKFVISYNPIKELEIDKEYILKNKKGV